MTTGTIMTTDGKKSLPAVKFCGFTNKEELDLAVSLGVDALGLVFYDKSPRYVNADQAQWLIADVPPFVTIVALVVNMDETALVRLAQAVAFDVLQFHGDEDPKTCQYLAGKINKRWIKAIRVGKEGQDTEWLNNTLLSYKQAGASGVILDAYIPHQFGGTGKRFDWRLIPSNPPLPIILAGGLTADNVKAVAQFPIWGVDVSGGIEWAKGRKCGEKMARFIKNVQSK